MLGLGWGVRERIKGRTKRLSTLRHRCVYFHCPGGPATTFPLLYEVIHLPFNIFGFLFLATEKVLSDPEILSFLLQASVSRYKATLGPGLLKGPASLEQLFTSHVVSSVFLVCQVEV